MSDRTGDIEIYIANVHGTALQRLTFAPGRDAHPSFSPNGKKVAFQSPRENRQPQIYVMNVDGTDQERLTDLPGFSGVPDWSPDGKQIVFQSNLNPTLEPPHWQIFLMNSDGTILRQLSHDSYNDQVPKWSPDGKRILFYSDKTGHNQLYTMRRDGSHWQRMTHDLWNNNAASWSHDGRRVLFTSDRGNGTDIYTFDLKTRHETHLTSNAPGEGIPFWSPDDKTIAFTFRRGDHSEVRLMDADGSHLRTFSPAGTLKAVALDGSLLVANSAEDTVAIVNPLCPEDLHKIATGKHPQDVLVSPDGSRAYVAEMGTDESPGNTVAVVETETGRVVARLELGKGTLPHLLALSHDGKELWVACAPENAIVELDTIAGTVKTWDTLQKGSYLMAVTPDEKKLYVANFDAGTVSVIRRSDGWVQVLPVGGQPIGIDVSPDGSAVWVSNFETNTISVIDPATDRIVRTFPSGGDGPARLKFTRNGREVWVTHSRSNELMIYDAGEGRVLRTIPIGKFPKGLVILPDDEHGFVSVMDEDRVVEVEIPTGRVVASLNTGAAPEGLAWISAQPGWNRATKCHTPTE